MYYFLFDNHSEKLKEIMPATAKMLAQTDPMGVCLGAVDEDNELVGYLVLYPSTRRKTMIRINDIKVAKANRLEGIGATLIENAKKLSTANDYTDMGICVEIGSDAELFVARTGFLASDREYTVLSYTLEQLSESKVIQLANQNKKILPEVKKIPVRNHDLILRFDEKCKEHNYYFEKNDYDTMLTVFCVDENDIVGAAALEVFADGHLRISDWFVDENSKTQYIVPALIMEIINTAFEFFERNTVLELCVDINEDIEKYTAMLGDPITEKQAREYYCYL